MRMGLFICGLIIVEGKGERCVEDIEGMCDGGLFACVYNASSFVVLPPALHADRLCRPCQTTTYKSFIVCFSVATYYGYVEYFLQILCYKALLCSVYVEIC